MRLGDSLDNQIRRRGEVMVYRTLHEGGTWRVTFPVCSIVEEGEGDNRLVVELDASVTHQIIDPYELPDLHVCEA
jgi:hypothetical protein